MGRLHHGLTEMSTWKRSSGSQAVGHHINGVDNAARHPGELTIPTSSGGTAAQSVL